MEKVEEMVEALSQVEVTEEKPSKVFAPPEEELEQYRYADAVITCKKCGRDTIIKHPMFNNVETAVPLPPLYTNNRSFLGLACEYCDDMSLNLRMIPAVHPPAYDFNYKGFEVPQKITLTWSTGKEPATFSVYMLELTEEKTEKTPELVLVGSTTEPSFELELKEDTSYKVRVDTIYGSEVFNSDVIMLSTKAKPEAKEVTAVPQIEENK